MKGARVSVLLRGSAVESGVPAEQRDIAGIRSLGIGIVTSDLVTSLIDELASLFAPYDTVIGCAGYAGYAAGIVFAEPAISKEIVYLAGDTMTARIGANPGPDVTGNNK